MSRVVVDLGSCTKGEVIYILSESNSFEKLIHTYNENFKDFIFLTTKSVPANEVNYTCLKSKSTPDFKQIAPG